MPMLMLMQMQLQLQLHRIKHGSSFAGEQHLMCTVARVGMYERQTTNTERPVGITPTLLSSPPRLTLSFFAPTFSIFRFNGIVPVFLIPQDAIKVGLGGGEGDQESPQ